MKYSDGQMWLTPYDSIQDSLNQIRPGAQWYRQRVNLSPGVYPLKDTINVPPNVILDGAGTESTILQRIRGGSLGAIIEGQYWGHDITVSNMSLDCNGTAGYGAILYGDNLKAYDLEIYGHISPVIDGKRRESFAVLLANQPGSGATVTDLRIRRCKVRDSQASYNGGLVVAPSAGLGEIRRGIIQDCEIIGVPSPEPGYDMVGVIGAQYVTHCYLENVCVGIYTEGLPGGMVITDTQFRKIRGTAARINLERPQESFSLINCGIELLEGATGIDLYGTTPKLGRLYVAQNQFYGKGRWLRVIGCQSADVIGNTFDPGQDTEVRGCQGYADSNVSRDRKWKTISGPITSTSGNAKKGQLPAKLVTNKVSTS